MTSSEVDDDDRLDERDPPGLGHARHLAPASSRRRRCRAGRPRARSATRAMPGRELLVDARAERRRRAVGATASPCRRSRFRVRVASSRCELDLGGGPLELELLDALDGGPGEERLVADEVQAVARRGAAARAAPAGRRARARLRSRRAVPARRPRRTRARRSSAPRPRRRPPTRTAASSTPKRAASCDEPRELVRARAASPRGAAAAAGLRGSRRCRRARGSSCPAGRDRPSRAARPWNIETAITDSARSASARTFGSFAASSPETSSSPIDSGSAPSSSEAAAHASATPRRVRRGRDVEGAAAVACLRARASRRARRRPRRRGRAGRTRSARRVPHRRSRRRSRRRARRRAAPS